MKIFCECKESINIHRSKDPTLLVEWNDWICDHLFRHGSIYSQEGDPFQLTFRGPETGGEVKVFEEIIDAATGEKKEIEVTDQYDDESPMVGD